jgi:hypothetical protein
MTRFMHSKAWKDMLLLGLVVAALGGIYWIWTIWWGAA